MKQTVFLKKTLTIGLLFLACSITHAQVALVTSGGTASGSGASANYTVGQAIQETLISSNGISIQGIQFYFPSSTLTIIDLETNLDISTYPNPTSSSINIEIKDFLSNELSYKLYNILGQPLLNNKIRDNTTKININHLPDATYLLKVSNSKNTIIKTFKIIKN